jgi:hypothetical protein
MCVFEESDVPPETVEWVNQVADRLAISLESVRLLQETRSTAEREQLVGRVTAQMRANLDVDAVLRTAAARSVRSWTCRGSRSAWRPDRKVRRRLSNDETTREKLGFRIARWPIFYKVFVFVGLIALLGIGGVSAALMKFSYDRLQEQAHTALLNSARQQADWVATLLLEQVAFVRHIGLDSALTTEAAARSREYDLTAALRRAERMASSRGRQRVGTASRVCRPEPPSRRVADLCAGISGGSGVVGGGAPWQHVGGHLSSEASTNRRRTGGLRLTRRGPDSSS